VYLLLNNVCPGSVTTQSPMSAQHGRTVWISLLLQCSNGYPVLRNSRGGLWSHIVIRVFLLLGTVCPRHPPYPELPSCPLSSSFPYPQSADTGGCRSAPAICQSLTSADPTLWIGIAMSTGGGFIHRTGRNCKFCVTVGPVNFSQSIIQLILVVWMLA